MKKFFDVYVKQGLKPIPLIKKTKIPASKGWQKNWSVERWQDYFKNDKYNMGILLGDIIDVEADSPDSAAFLNSMIKNVERPMFYSSKSMHNLFLSPDPELRRFVFDGIEFRGHLHHSMVPPSIHPDGPRYWWMKSSRFPIPSMPSDLLEYYFNKKAERKKTTKKIYLKPGFLKTRCRICQEDFFIHRKRLFLECKAFKTKGYPWMCHGCREFNIKQDCRKIKKEIYQEFAQENQKIYSHR